MTITFDVAQNDPGAPITVTAARATGGTTIAVSGWPAAWTAFPMLLTASRAGAVLAHFRVTGQASGVLSGVTAVEGADAALQSGDLLSCRPTAGNDAAVKAAINANAPGGAVDAIQYNTGSGLGGFGAWKEILGEITLAVPGNVLAPIFQTTGASAGVIVSRRDTSAAAWTFYSTAGDLAVFNNALSGNAIVIAQTTQNVIMAGALSVTGGVVAASFQTSGSGAGYVVTRRDTGAASWQFYDGSDAFRIYNQALAGDAIVIASANNDVFFSGKLHGDGSLLTGVSAGLAIGNTVTGGTAGRVLFAGAGSVLADSAGLTWNGTTMTVGTGYPAQYNLTVAYGNLTFQHGPTPGGFTLQNIYNGGTVRLQASPGDILTVIGGGGIGVYSLQDNLSGKKVVFGGTHWDFETAVYSLHAGSANDDYIQDAIHARPVAVLAAYWRPFAAYIGASDDRPSWSITMAGDESFARRSSTATIRDVASVNAVWADSTDASRKGKLVLSVADSTGTDKTGITIASNGTVADVVIPIANVRVAANDAAAAALVPPCPIGGLYRSGSQLFIRVT